MIVIFDDAIGLMHDYCIRSMNTNPRANTCPLPMYKSNIDEGSKDFLEAHGIVAAVGTAIRNICCPCGLYPKFR